MRQIEDCPELNLSNYNADDVARLNDWAVRADAEIDRLQDALGEIALAGMSGTGMESEEAMRDWHARRAWEFIGIAARALRPDPKAVEERRPLGAALAMRVMQSDLYDQLDVGERADCDELVRRNLEWFRRDSARGVLNIADVKEKRDA